ncbi:DUF742 domain-containing protein [Kitasatospora sp. NPDC049285]|uniref:DUF742 domain-containing protein n=1 Tax=Kitasatospora sp. NPDC049285 TaxID=3157096 RepID=UPI00344753A9
MSEPEPTEATPADAPADLSGETASEPTEASAGAVDAVSADAVTGDGADAVIVNLPGGGGGQESADEPSIDLFTPRTPVDDRWFDDDAGPVVRLFAMTRGRAARPVDDGLFDLISLVTAAGPAVVGPGGVPGNLALDPEHHAILALCREEPLSVAELGSYTDLPVSVVRVLLGDLHDAELISVTRPVQLAHQPDERLLRDVINGLRAL